jgi:hypothetical protein
MATKFENTHTHRDYYLALLNWRFRRADVLSDIAGLRRDDYKIFPIVTELADLRRYPRSVLHVKQLPTMDYRRCQDTAQSTF